MKALEPFILLAVAIVLLGGALLWDAQDHTPRQLAQLAQSIEDDLLKQEEEMRLIMEDDDFVRRLLAPRYDAPTWEAIHALHERSFDLFVTRGDSMVFWSSNRVQPPLHSAQAQEASAVGITLFQSKYLYLQRPIDVNGQAYMVMGLIPIYRAYDLNNQHLTNAFVVGEGIPKSVTPNDLGKGHPVRTEGEALLFYIDADGSLTGDGAVLVLFVIYGLGVVFLSAYLNRLAIRIGRYYQPVYGLGALVAMIAAMRSLVNALLPYTVFADHGLFVVPDQSEIIVAGTLQQLIDSILLLWIMTYGYREIKLPIPRSVSEHPLSAMLLSVTYYGGIYAMLLLLNEAVAYLVQPTRTAMDFDNLFEFSLYTLVGISIITVLTLTLLLLTHKVVQRLQHEAFAGTNRTLLGGIFLGITFGLSIMGLTTPIHLLLSLFFVGYVALFETYLTDHRASYQWIGGFLFTHAFLVAALLIYHNIQHEQHQRLAHARLLSAERDVAFERSFQEILPKFPHELHLTNLRNPLIPRATTEAALVTAVQSAKHIKQHYDMEIALFDREGQGLRGETRDFASMVHLFQVSDSTLTPHLRFYNKARTHSYIARLPLYDSQGALGAYLFMQYHPKGIQSFTEYPELLIDRSLAQLPGLQYQYAHYFQGTLTHSNNKGYPNQLDFDAPPHPKSYHILQRDGKSHLIYRSTPDKVVVVTKAHYPVFQYISLFSYLFLFMGCTAIVMALLGRFHHLMPRQFIYVLTPRPSLHNSIQVSILLIIIITFVTIGAVTFYYFTQDSQEYHKGRLDRKTTGVISSAQYWIQQNQQDTSYQIDVAALAAIHRVDINLFDTTGRLVTSSQPLIFGKGLLAPQINPLAFRRMQQQQLTEDTAEEQIGKLHFRTAYLNIRNAQGRTLAYIGMPYYSERSDLNEDIADFAGVLLNIFVLLLIVAFVAAYVTAKSITHPLAVLKNKLQRLKLGQKNAPLQWARKDEIGVLIDEYNRALTQLEASAKRIAESEREGAWREMAKQVAHEIKNPLTPMKLSMQYLVRAYQTRPEAIGPMLERVSKTMIEQIDGLARIATEFSNFAKMPKAENEVINLNALVASTFNLFSENDDLDMELQLPIQDHEVFADKEQLLRVFNNVIKNAIQAIPDGRKAQINISLETTSSRTLRVAVQDNGTGIPINKQDLVFVPHFTTKNSGTGLGLAICKKIVEQAEGSIYFRTQPNIGTTFYIELPEYRPAR